jgi:hypothetical protein
MYIGFFARLSSPWFNYTTHRCITFWYHIGSSGGLRILVVREDGSETEAIWTLSGDQGYNWQQGRASIPDVSSNITVCIFIQIIINILTIYKRWILQKMI